MSVQITVRLPGELVSFLDNSVAEGCAQSRAALVASALEREMRRQAAIADTRILAEQGLGDDLDALWCPGRSRTLPWRTDVREICLAELDKTRPVLVLTRELAREAMTKVTVAPIASTVKGLSSELRLGPDNGLAPGGLIRGRVHQPRSRHSPRWGRSAPSVVGAPWPGRTRVSSPKRSKSFVVTSV